MTDLFFCSYKSDPSMETELTLAKSVFILRAHFPTTHIHFNSVVYFVDNS